MNDELEVPGSATQHELNDTASRIRKPLRTTKTTNKKLSKMTSESHPEKTGFCICETKTQISFAVTAKLISAFVFTAQIVKSFYSLNPEFHVSNHLLWLYSPVCIGPGRKPRRPVFSERGSSRSRTISHPFPN